jgi:hypothetical protein
LERYHFTARRAYSKTKNFLAGHIPLMMNLFKEPISA